VVAPPRFEPVSRFLTLFEDRPARIFVCVPEWPGPFDIEIDCVAVVFSS
jgi:hypothetical protein